MRYGWLVLLLALLLGDVTAARGDDFTIATSAEQVAVLQALTDSANAARAIENSRIAEETARLAALTPPQPPRRFPLPMLTVDAFLRGEVAKLLDGWTEDSKQERLRTLRDKLDRADPATVDQIKTLLGVPLLGVPK